MILEDKEAVSKLREKTKEAHYPSLAEVAEDMEIDPYLVYKITGESGTISYSHTVTWKKEQAQDFLASHRINEHLIFTTLDEFCRSNRLVKWLLKLGIIDKSVIALNQIMYTFHRQSIGVVESTTSENWYWNEHTFKKLNSLLKYDYDDNFREMLVSEFSNSFFKFLWVVFVFGVISMINAVFIRISIKCSVLIIFPMIEM